MLFGSAYGWWLTENYNATPGSSQANDRINTDSSMFGVQAGMKFALFGGETRLAAHYYDCGGCQDQLAALQQRRERQHDVQGARQRRHEPADVRLQHRRTARREMGMTLFNQPFSFWADYLNNTASDVQYDTAYAVGVIDRQGRQSEDLAGGRLVPVDRQGRAVRAVRRFGLRERQHGRRRLGARAATRRSGTSPSRDVLPQHAEQGRGADQRRRRTACRTNRRRTQLQPAAAGPELQVLVAHAAAASPHPGLSQAVPVRREGRPQGRVRVFLSNLACFFRPSCTNTHARRRPHGNLRPFAPHPQPLQRGPRGRPHGRAADGRPGRAAAAERRAGASSTATAASARRSRGTTTRSTPWKWRSTRTAAASSRRARRRRRTCG